MEACVAPCIWCGAPLGNIRTPTSLFTTGVLGCVSGSRGGDVYNNMLFSCRKKQPGVYRYGNPAQRCLSIIFLYEAIISTLGALCSYLLFYAFKDKVAIHGLSWIGLWSNPPNRLLHILGLLRMTDRQWMEGWVTPNNQK
jgi:hypothetical protein